ncbi:MAG: protein kinase [Kofleriaceae bacterium]
MNKSDSTPSRAELVRQQDSQRVDKLIGEVLANRYQIEARLGEGAMGSVYKARHVKVGRPFAVKVLHPRLLEDSKTLQRFEREAELAGRLRHPIGVVDVGETTDGLRYMVMDFAEGHDLAALLGEAPMPPARVINLTRQMLEGLYHAHEAGLIHRDFKPENVIVEKDTHGEEVPRIVDFGIAILREGGTSSDGTGRLTTNGLVLGTPHYMAPEQAVDDPIDHRIDLFALGIMIYEMLCGKLPFDGHGAEVAGANLLLDPPLISDRVPYLEVDPLLEALSRRMMAKKRDARPATAKAALAILTLIETDRNAAAAQLNVPLAAAARAPRSTEPVHPRHQVADYPGTFPPPFREAATPKQAPTMNAAVAVRTRTPAKGVEIPNDTAASEPVLFLSDEQPAVHTPRRRMAFIAAAIAALLLGGIGVAILASGGDKKPVAKPPEKLAVVEQPKPVLPPPPPEVKIETPPVVKVETPPPPVVRTQPRPPVVKIQPKPPGLTVETPRPHVGSETRPQVAIVETPKSPVYDADAFKRQFTLVGRELADFKAKHRDVNVADLDDVYAKIKYFEATSMVNTRTSAKATLDDIHAKLSARQK